jgi:hypothetical protein
MYIDRSSMGWDHRCVLVGIAFSGPFVCVRIHQLKSVLGRCKSSINGSFQQLGYASIKTKANCYLLNILPFLIQDASAMRQWTVRVATETAEFCFVARRKFPIRTRPLAAQRMEPSALQIPPPPSHLPMPVFGVEAFEREPVTSCSFPTMEPGVHFEDKVDGWEEGMNQADYDETYELMR